MRDERYESIKKIIFLKSDFQQPKAYGSIRAHTHTYAHPYIESSLRTEKQTKNLGSKYFARSNQKGGWRKLAVSLARGFRLDTPQTAPFRATFILPPQ